MRMIKHGSSKVSVNSPEWLVAQELGRRSHEAMGLVLVARFPGDLSNRRVLTKASELHKHERPRVGGLDGSAQSGRGRD
jgi:hypothetical protein